MNEPNKTIGEGILEYNSAREKLLLPEYGRNIQKLVQHAKTIEDPEKRQWYVEILIELMNQMLPGTKTSKEIEDKLRSAGFSKVEARYSYGTPGKISWRLSMKYPIVFLGKVPRLLGFLVLPFYYVIAYPIAFVLNFFDTRMTHTTGTGLIVKAWK